MIKNFLLVGLGGGIGSMLRYASSLLIPSRFFPWSTFAVNITGSFIIGIILALSMRDEVFMNNWKLFLATGICGGFTTFSSFSAENIELLQSGKYTLAFTYICCSILFGIAAAWAGVRIISN
jgi:CrcB protein